jgi:SAM-dependent methyltransferase
MVVAPLSSSLHGLSLSSLQWLLDHHRTKEPQRRQMVADLHFQAGERVLDLGCGPGLWTSMFAEKVAPTGKIVGLDFSPELIDYAVSQVAGESLGDAIHFVLGNFLKIPFRDRTFDSVFLGNCASYVSDVLSFIQEMKRVTRVGGRVVSKEFDDGAIIFNPVHPHLTAKVLQAVTGVLSKTSHIGGHEGDGPAVGRDPFVAAEPSVPQFDNFMGRKMHGLFLRSGFEDVSIRTYAIQVIAPLSPEAKRYLQGNAEWLGATAAPYLLEEDRRQWQAAFDPDADEYVLDREDFYFCMVEMITVGTISLG